jgi:P4 family phage/plasmid primase-like protien
VFYMMSLLYLEATYGLKGDPACKDFTRLYRLPKVVREGKGQLDGQVLGDRLAVWDFAACDEFLDEADELENPKGPGPGDSRTGERRSPQAPEVRDGIAASGYDRRAEFVPWDDVSEQERKIRTKRARAYLAKMPPGIQDGNGGGSDATWAAALALTRGFGLPQDVALDLMWTDYNPRCVPPWDDKEKLAKKVRETAESQSTDAPPVGYILLDRRQDAPAPAPPAAQTFESDTEVYLAKVLASEARTRLGCEPEHLVWDRSSHYRYNPETGIWQEEQDETQLLRAAQAFDGALFGTGEGAKRIAMSSRKVKGVVEMLRVLLRNEGQGRGFFDQRAAGIAFRNGFLRVEEGAPVLVPHSHSHRILQCVEYDYDPSCPTPLWNEALKIWLNEEADDYEERVAVLQEFVGAALFGQGSTFTKVLLLKGPGGDGKSTLMRVIESLFPGVASLPPQEWQERNMLESLADNMLNSVSELEEKGIFSASAFKSIVDGNQTTVNPKYKKPYSFAPRTAHIFACNALPRVSDLTPGFWRRWIILEFDRLKSMRVRTTYDVRILPERPGIAAWAVQGYLRLLQRDAVGIEGTGAKATCYTQPASSEEALRRWRFSNDQVSQFVAELFPLTNANPHTVTGSDLYAYYTYWARLNGVSRMSQTQFGERIKALVESKKTGGVVRYMSVPSQEMVDWAQTRAVVNPSPVAQWTTFPDRAENGARPAELKHVKFMQEAFKKAYDYEAAEEKLAEEQRRAAEIRAQEAAYNDEEWDQ